MVIHRCILATDMARHNDILNQFKSVQSDFDFQNKEHKDVVSLGSKVNAAVCIRMKWQIRRFRYNSVLKQELPRK